MNEFARSLDELGRIVIPKEYRRMNNWNPKDLIYISATNQGLCLRKLNKSCCICGATKNLISNGEQQLCYDCIDFFVKRKGENS